MSKGWARLSGVIIAFLLVSIWCIILDRREMKAQVRPRFQEIYNEQAEWNGGRHDQTVIRNFEVWHDRESGQEFICADPSTSMESAYKISCWPTGRNWK